MLKTELNDIVITYDANINSENRLRTILRAIENECQGFNEIIIVGDRPDWIQGVIHIGFNGCNGPDDLLKNQYRKLRAVCLDRTVTEGIYWVDADDTMIRFDARKGNRISIPAGSVMSYRPKGKEKISYDHTEKLMKRRGFGMNSNFFNKYPMSFSKEKLKNTFDDIDFDTRYGYCIKTLYANFNRLRPTEREIEILNLTDYTTKSSYEKV